MVTLNLLIGFLDLKETCVGQWIFTDFPLRSVFMNNARFAMVVLVKFAVWPRMCAALCKTSKQAVHLSVHQDGRRPSAQIPEILDTEASTAEM
jgi:hypothetical protein